MSNNPELLKTLIDNDEFEDVELQKKKSSVIVVTGVAISSSNKKTAARRRVVTGRSRCPCWCKCIAITMAVFSLIGMFALGCVYFWLKNALNQLTVETGSPQKFPIVEMSEQELYIVKERVMLFVDELADGRTGDLDDLVLTQDEINGFIDHSDYLRGNMMVTLHENRIEEEYSLPMDVLGLDGRYFVANDYIALVGEGEGEKKDLIEMKMETAATHEDWFDGPLFFAQLQYLITKNKDDEGQTVLELFLENGSFFGQVIPEEVIDERENLLESLYDDHDDDDEVDVEYIRDVINGIERVSIEEGKIVVKPRRTGSN